MPRSRWFHNGFFQWNNPFFEHTLTVQNFSMPFYVFIFLVMMKNKCNKLFWLFKGCSGSYWWTGPVWCSWRSQICDSCSAWWRRALSGKHQMKEEQSSVLQPLKVTELHNVTTWGLVKGYSLRLFLINLVTGSHIDLSLLNHCMFLAFMWGCRVLEAWIV